MNHRLADFTPLENSTWQALYDGQSILREQQLLGLFSEGLNLLEMSARQIPDLVAINRILAKRTGFKGVPVQGLEGPQSFFKLLANREFPIGNFIRSQDDLSYTPAPDVFHDLYGHIPFYTDLDYANFCQKLGEAAFPYFDDPERLRQFERFFWFTFEFALIRTSQGLRIFGAGIASSRGECQYSLSGQPELVPFDLDRIRMQEFKIDQMQKRLFVLEDERQLYGCLDDFVRKVKGPCGAVIPAVSP